MYDRRGIHVVLQAPDGRYLSGHRQAWSFTEERERATVFDFVADHIAEQLETLKRDEGLTLEAVPLDPCERYEVCDLCGHRVMSFKAFFDGQQFLCPACRTQMPPST